MIASLVIAVLSFTLSGLPDGWILQPHREYQPAPRCRRAMADGTEVLCIDEIKGVEGSLFGPAEKIPAVKGRCVVVKATVRGEGRVSASLARFTATGGWNWRTRPVERELTGEWKEHVFDIPVEDTPVGVTAKAMVWLEAEKGTKRLEMKNVSWHTRSLAFPGSVAMETVETLDRDDYDDIRRKRPGSPKIVKGDFMPGIPKQSNRGRYEFTAPCNLTLPKKRYSMPDVSRGEFFAFGVRVYRLENASASFTFATSPNHARRVDFPPVEKERLPADFIFAVDADGSCTKIVRSLADTSTVRSGGFDDFFRGLSTSFVAAVSFRPEGVCGIAEIDEFFAARAKNESAPPLPIKVTPEDRFDPVEKKWPLVFSEEFDGDRLDMRKWFIPSWRRKDADTVTLDGNGKLRIIAVPDRENGILRSSGIWTREKFRYGYFEARLKFTYLPGWCAAFWLYGMSTKNPLIDGMEVDIFEDYPTRRQGKKPCNSHNLHNNTPHEAAKSWSFHSPMPADRDFHVFGCKWTPFEISEYLDGRLIRTVERVNGRDCVTFDALSTAACNAPLHVILSGSISKSSRGKVDFDAHRFPEAFVVDWVRVYAWPDEKNGPAVSWRGDTLARTVKCGESLRFSVAAAAGTSKVKGVYIFDNGYPIAFKSAPPFDFEIPFTLEHYRTTLFMKPGRSGIEPSFDDHVHAFAAFAEDDGGVVTSTGPVLRVPERVRARRWDGKRLGVVRSTDCFVYAFENGRAGRRTLAMRYSFSGETETDWRCKVLVGGVEKAEFRLPAPKNATAVSEVSVELPSGKCELLFVPIGVFTVYGLELR